MEKDLKEKLESLLKLSSEEIIFYFCAGEFLEECENHFEVQANDKITSVLDYLTEEIYKLDIDYREDKKFDTLLRDVLKNAIKMLESTK